MPRFVRIRGEWGFLAIATMLSACRGSSSPPQPTFECLDPACKLRRPTAFCRPPSVHERPPADIHPDNPRYFTDGEGKPILLVGSHTWTNLQDYSYHEPLPPFDYQTFLDF